MYVQLEDRLAELQDLEVRVLEAWAERRAQYQEDLELQQLQRELEQAEHWLNTYENALKAEDYGVWNFWEKCLHIWRQHKTPFSFKISFIKSNCTEFVDRTPFQMFWSWWRSRRIWKPWFKLRVRDLMPFEPEEYR